MHGGLAKKQTNNIQGVATARGLLGRNDGKNHRMDPKTMDSRLPTKNDTQACIPKTLNQSISGTAGHCSTYGPALRTYCFAKRCHCTALGAMQHPSITPTSFLMGWAEKLREIKGATASQMKEQRSQRQWKPSSGFRVYDLNPKPLI